MNEPINRLKQKWEAVPSDDGDWTIQTVGSNGEPSGTVATVYGKALADCIVSDHNFVIAKEEL
jgi:hypothetical protein